MLLYQNEVESEIYTIVYLCIAIVAIFPLIGFMITYKRVKDKGIFVLLIAFLLFFIKGLVLSSEMFVDNFDDNITLLIAGILDFFIISLVSYAIVLRVKNNQNDEQDSVAEENEESDNEDEL